MEGERSHHKVASLQVIIKKKNWQQFWQQMLLFLEIFSKNKILSSSVLNRISWIYLQIYAIQEKNQLKQVFFINSM